MMSPQQWQHSYHDIERSVRKVGWVEVKRTLQHSSSNKLGVNYIRSKQHLGILTETDEAFYHLDEAGLPPIE
jgi:hypothetical protein